MDIETQTDEQNVPRHPPKVKKAKVYYQNKKDAATKLNYLQKNPHNKKRPLRVYQDSSGWHLTKLELVDKISLIDLIEAALKYSDGKRFGSGGIYKREWEEEKRLRDAINKTILNFK